MPEDKLTDPVIEPDVDAPDTTPADIVATVDLDTPKSTVPSKEPVPAPITQKPDETDEAFSRRMKSMENQTYGNRRLLEGLQGKISELEASLKKPAPEPAKPSPSGTDFWSEVDPRARPEISRLIQEEANRLFVAKEAERQFNES